ncbi:MAG: PAS domain-containing protein, partial [Nitrosomonas sp.]|nr:PAS domain-containing protein [Nitrosomonas sp.]
MAVTNQHPHTAASLEVQIRQASKLRVLLIEDNAFDAEILMTLMAQTCYAEAEVICHASIAGALEILSKEHLDIIILDLSLKDSEVSETLSRLKELTVFAPVIISSSLDDKKTIRKIISLGAEDCLPKRDLSSALLERVVTYAIDRWRLARDLHKTNERLTNILGGTGIGTWEWHVPTGAMIIDEDFARILGYSLAALLPFTRDKWIDCIHPEDRGRANELLTRNFTVDNQYYDCEMRVRHKSGQWIWALSRGKLISHIHHNQPEWIVGTLLNITQCKQNEESLRIIQLVYQNTSEAIMITDRNACIIDV